MVMLGHQSAYATYSISYIINVIYLRRLKCKKRVD